jgi:hypothetical protein
MLVPSSNWASIKDRVNGMFLLRTIILRSILSLFIILAAQQSYAATSGGLINALNIEAQTVVDSHSLITATETDFGTRQTSTDNSIANIDENSIIISNIFSVVAVKLRN